MLKNILMLEVEKKEEKRSSWFKKDFSNENWSYFKWWYRRISWKKLKNKRRIKEKKKRNNQKKKEVNSGYWSTPIKPKEEEEKQTIEKEVETEKSFGPEEWIKTERDYIYNELVERIYGTLKTKNPQLCTEKK